MYTNTQDNKNISHKADIHINIKQHTCTHSNYNKDISHRTHIHTQNKTTHIRKYTAQQTHKSQVTHPNNKTTNIHKFTIQQIHKLQYQNTLTQIHYETNT